MSAKVTMWGWKRSHCSQVMLPDGEGIFWGIVPHEQKRFSIIPTVTTGVMQLSWHPVLAAIQSKQHQNHAKRSQTSNWQQCPFWICSEVEDEPYKWGVIHQTNVCLASDIAGGIDSRNRKADANLAITLHWSDKIIFVVMVD